MNLLNFLNAKAKAFVIMLFALLSICVVLLTTYLSVHIFSEWHGLIAGIILMLLAIPFHIFGKKNSVGYLVSYLLNSIGGGFSVSAYYTVKECGLNMYEMLLGVLPSATILFLVFLMLQAFGKTKKVTLTVAAVINVLLLVAVAALWIKFGALFFSFCFFCLLISLFYLCVFGVSVNRGERSVLRDISFGSFGSFIILTVVVIFILSEGDALEALDIGIGGEKKGKRKGKL